MIPHTGATKGMEIPPFATSLAQAVLCDPVGNVGRLIDFLSDHLLLLYRQNSMHPQATRSVMSALSSERKIFQKLDLLNGQYSGLHFLLAHRILFFDEPSHFGRNEVRWPSEHVHSYEVLAKIEALDESPEV